MVEDLSSEHVIIQMLYHNIVRKFRKHWHLCVRLRFDHGHEGEIKLAAALMEEQQN